MLQRLEHFLLSVTQVFPPLFAFKNQEVPTSLDNAVKVARQTCAVPECEPYRFPVQPGDFAECNPDFRSTLQSSKMAYHT